MFRTNYFNSMGKYYFKKAWYKLTYTIWSQPLYTNKKTGRRYIKVCYLLAFGIIDLFSQFTIKSIYNFHKKSFNVKHFTEMTTKLSVALVAFLCNMIIIIIKTLLCIYCFYTVVFFCYLLEQWRVVRCVHQSYTSSI